MSQPFKYKKKPAVTFKKRVAIHDLVIANIGDIGLLHAIQFGDTVDDLFVEVSIGKFWINSNNVRIIGEL